MREMNNNQPNMSGMNPLLAVEHMFPNDSQRTELLERHIDLKQGE
jgi:hypothetical protein